MVGGSPAHKSSMKKILLHLAILATIKGTALAGSFFGPSPFSQGWYYPGQMDGKYQASVTGVNIAGAVGFAFQDGAPTVSTNSAATSNGGTNVVQNTVVVDPFQNYFVVFVQGMTYSGNTTATINIDQGTVTGALFSQQNAFSLIELEATAGAGATATNQIILNNLPLLNRGVNGGFTADIDSKKAVFTFSGTGELSAPAFPQTIQGLDTNGNIVPSSEFVSNAVTAILQTTTVPFDISGIKVSSSAASTIAQPTTGN
jgi:hypothetical protein